MKGKKLEGMFANMQIKKMDIDKKIRELSEQDGRMFNKVLVENLRDIDWCGSHKINYRNPDYQIAREKTYQEMYKRDE